MAGLHQLQSNTSLITANALNTSQSSLFQHTSATSIITSNAQNTSLMSNYAPINATNHLVSLNGVSNQVTLNAGSNLSLSQGAGASNTAFTFNVTGVVQGSQSSLFQHTSATSAITSNAFPTANSTNLVNTSVSSNFQQTSATSAITSNAFPSANTTKFAGSGFTTASTIGSDLVGTQNSLGLSLGVPKWLTVAAGAGDGYNPAQFTNSTANSTQNILWAGNSNGSGNITFGLTGSTVTASHAAILTANSSLFQHTSATSAITSNAFANSATTNFAGAGFTTASTAGSNLVGTVDSSGVSLGVPNWLTIAAGAGDGYNQAGFTNLTANSTQNLVWAGNSNGSGNVTMGLTGSTVTMSAPNGGGGGYTASSTVFGDRYQWQSTSSSMGQNTIHFLPLNLAVPLNASHIIFPIAMTFSTSAVSSARVSHTMSYALYTRVASAPSMLSTIMSSSFTLGGSVSSNVSMSYDVATTITASNGYGNKQSSSAGINISADMHGIREIRMPFNTSLTAGEYWIAMANSSSLVGGTVGNLLRISHIGGTSNILQNFGVAIASNNANAFRDVGLGIYQTTTGAFPNTVSFSQIAQTNQIIPKIILVNRTM